MKIIKYLLVIILFIKTSISYGNDSDFLKWKSDFKKYALTQNISIRTLNKIIDNAKFLPDVIKYDRYQPEFYEDTKTYIKKRTSIKKITKGKKIYNKNKNWK